MAAKPKNSVRKVLVIEDDEAIAEVLNYNLQRDGYEVLCCRDGYEGLRQARVFGPQLVILDLMLPSLDGLEICRELRADKATKHLAILMLTAKSEETDQIVGFSVGADDYVTKPFSVKVLLQRVRVLFNRLQQPVDEGDVLERHGIAIDRVGHQVHCFGQLVELTPTEYKLLETLMRQAGRAFSRSDLLQAAVGDETIVLERTIDVHIRSLRQKLGDRAGVIETVRGVGYRFAREMTET